LWGGSVVGGSVAKWKRRVIAIGTRRRGAIVAVITARRRRIVVVTSSARRRRGVVVITSMITSTRRGRRIVVVPTGSGGVGWIGPSRRERGERGRGSNIPWPSSWRSGRRGRRRRKRRVFGLRSILECSDQMGMLPFEMSDKLAEVDLGQGDISCH